ncbi:MAG: ATP-binding protein [Balneolaceae bacterium]|nr:ATP-binding protein [Balneolaceae bacterium]
MLKTKSLSVIFDTLPRAYAILAPAPQGFVIEEVNRAFLNLTGRTKDELAGNNYFDVFPKELNQYQGANTLDLSEILQQVTTQNEKHVTAIVKHTLTPAGKKNSEPRYWQFTNVPVCNNDEDEVAFIIQELEDVTEQLTKKEKRQNTTRQLSSRSQLQVQNKVLEDQIAQKINQYRATNKELTDFIYSVSHDLRAPLRRIDGFSQELMNSCQHQLDETATHYLKRIRQGAQDMGNLIDDLLKLSRISRRKAEIESINISELAQSVFDQLIELEEDREVNFTAEKNLTAQVDKGLVKAMLTNLISNAIKFTGKKEKAEIEIGKTNKDGSSSFYIKDNGVGFDPAYADKLFKAFERLHSQKEFPGSGIGLATVKRIVTLHGGTIRAESTPDEGATFYFNFESSQQL